MAVELIGQQEDEKAKAGQTPAATVPVGETPQVVTGVQTPAGQAPNQPGGQAPAAAGRGKTGSGFVNLQKVLSANQQNRMGQAIQSGVQGQTQQVRSGVEQAGQQFKQQSQANAMGTQQQREQAQGILGRITGYQAPTNQQVSSMGFREGEQPNQAPAAPAPLVSDEEVKQFQDFSAGQYKGPRELANSQELQEKAIQAQQLGGLTGTVGGRQELLRRYVGAKPGYTGGKSALDALILGQTGAKQLQEAKRGTIGLGTKVSREAQAAQEIGKMRASEAQEFGKQLREQVGGGAEGQESGLIGGITGKLRTDLAAKQGQIDQEYGQFQQRLANKQLTMDDVNRYIAPLVSSGGITGDTSLFGTTPEQLASAFSKGQFGLESVADQATKMKLDALQKLSGRQDLTLDPTKLGQSGPSINVDSTQFGDLQKRQTDYGNELSQLQLAQSMVGKRKQELQQKQAELNKYEFTTVPTTGQQLIRNTQTGQVVSPDSEEYQNALTLRSQFSVQNQLGSISPEYGEYANELERMIPYYEREFGAQLPKLKEKSGAGDSLKSLLAADAAKQFEETYKPQYTTENTAYDEAKLQETLKKYGLYGPQELRGSGGSNLMARLHTGGGDLIQGAGDILGSVFSDRNLKENIKSGDNQVKNFLDKLKPYSYDYKDPSHGEGKQLSVMAQDLEKSELGKTGVEELPEGKAVNYGKLAGIMLAAQAQLNDRINKLEKGKK